MPRPPKVGLDYFPHDTTAASDTKIEALLSLCGVAGYGFYWYLIERIYREDDFMLDISDAETIQILSRNMSITTQDFDRYLQICLKRQLFRQDIFEETGKLSSNGVQKRAEIVIKKRLDSKAKYEQISNTKKVSSAETTQKRGVKLHKEKERK